MLFTLFLLAAFILLLSPEGLTNRCRLGFTRLFHWPLALGRSIPLAARSRPQPQEMTTRRQMQYENYIANLHEEIREQNAKIEQLAGIRGRLHGLDGAKLVLADIITTSIDATCAELSINHGSDDGVEVGQFVLTDNSIIGRISGVSARAAKVRLFTDPAFVLPVKVPNLGIDMLMRGAGGTTAKIDLVSVKHRINAADRVLAQKQPGFLNTGMVIGTITRCKHKDDNPALWDITVSPACKLDELTNVAVIVMDP